MSETPVATLGTRAAAALALAALLLGGAWLVRIVYHALADAWVAPLHLSPDNDRVVALRLEYTRHLAERRRMESELTAAEEAIRSIELSIERLRTLQRGYDDALTWAAGEETRNRKLLEKEVATLREQRELIEGLHDEHSRILDRGREDVKSGLITVEQLTRYEIALQQIELNLRALERQQLRAESELRIARSKSSALTSAARSAPNQRYGANEASAPDVLDFDEPAIRIELELARLGAERRAAEARREAVSASLEQMDELMREVRERPYYRAMHEVTDLAFVPYSSLEDISVGSPVNRCVLAFFACERVGTVTEIVPGEVVTQDPWGEIARGQYVVLDVDDPTALHEKVLRVRPGKRPRRIASASEENGS